MRDEQVVLVDERDRELGALDKARAHAEGRLHRALSVFVFDSEGALLLQRRARGKYHSGGLWTNTCCGHPRPGEATSDAARRRLREEMGVDCALRPVRSFVYRTAVGGGLLEHELDHLFVGRSDAVPRPDPAEVMAWRRAAVPALWRELTRRPGDFTAWLGLALRELAACGVIASDRENAKAGGGADVAARVS
jgi:isopentenyl-diphosphate Delta-isomerase